VTIAFADDKEFKQKMVTSEKPTNEMVRRLIPPLCQEDGGGSF
jgi:hypothetical protein